VTPALVTAAIFSFLLHLGRLPAPVDLPEQPEPLHDLGSIADLADPSSVTNWGAIFAMSTLALVPVFYRVHLIQRYLIEGIATSGLKG